ncbi:iron-sulfur cluster-binding protein [Desulfocucumis palustris]|uniref:Iron-sulfur cluster-binding protein n=1 Tax=Desulfocucumis palustris TaxID=1898651 RepID=A0A2L2XDT9_9FIRM|nr:epoxyqueuosine reductase [Desulfocucumis palustris]GBF33883.1 iron-sulfur cluster-binding protein [Desulfocucumis palustris]
MPVKDQIEAFVTKYIVSYRGNNSKADFWGAPLFAYADANDPLFLELKHIISPTHLLPAELLPDSKTVIAYFIPFNKPVVDSNVAGEMSSEQWANGYIETNKLIVGINEALSKELKKQGYQSVILPPTHNFDENTLISDWSHKHIGYIAGLGTFGLHQMLITEKGCCGRLGSLVTDAVIEPTPRPVQEYCLYKHNKTCRRCVARCFSGALKTEAFDRHRCYELLLENHRHHNRKELADVCGKCVSIVPCSFQRPKSS